MNRKKSLVLWFHDITLRDVPLVGGKNASLGEMYQHLQKMDIRVPNGFALTAYAYRYFLETTGIQKKIQAVLRGLNTRNMENLSSRGHAIRALILKTDFPEDLEQAIVREYRKLGKDVDVAVRSSATAEDLPDASFAGQQESFLNISGSYELLEAVKRCMASLFTNRAISYREDKKFDHFSIALSVGVQKMVRSDRAASGVMFTIDPNSGHRNVVVINASYGLGETVVKGRVDPDEFYIFKPTLQKKFRPIVGKTLGKKSVKLIYSIEGSEPTTEVPVPEDDRKRFCITDNEVLELASMGARIEKYYKRPMDIEWAKDGITKKLLIVQARPETVHSSSKSSVIEEYRLKQRGRIIVEGVAVGTRIGQGRARVIKDTAQMNKIQKGDVLVTEITDPDWEPIMKIASAIVTNSGGRTSHAAIVSRELGIPCVVGTHHATERIKDGSMVTVSCSEGDRGYVYSGILPFTIKKINIQKVPIPKTKIMEIVADPSTALDASLLPNSGVGLVREELIIAQHIRVHPLALTDFHKIQDPETRAMIQELTQGYKNKEDYFVDKLAEGVGKIVAAFWPKPVIVRMSDFKSNEYANLIGGKQFEPKEENPMIGWRGASRYYSEAYQKAFELECRAFKKVREIMGLTNMKIMIPFVRTPEEMKKVIRILQKQGLRRRRNHLEIYMMCEIPSNVILAKEFAKLVDGFSIGSNDLTQLTLGVDRDSALVAHIYDERNLAVKTIIQEVIRTCHRYGIEIGLCGQAPSDYPEIARFLVDAGIDSFSVTPDTLLKTILAVAKYEKMRRKK